MANVVEIEKPAAGQSPPQAPLVRKFLHALSFRQCVPTHFWGGPVARPGDDN